MPHGSPVPYKSPETYSVLSFKASKKINNVLEQNIGKKEIIMLRTVLATEDSSDMWLKMSVPCLCILTQNFYFLQIPKGKCAWKQNVQYLRSHNGRLPKQAVITGSRRQ